MSLKTILRNFLNHFETLEERRKCPNDDEDLYAIEFQSLKELTESLKRENFYACKHGLKDVNRRKNRYKDILPYDYSRVILSEYPGVPGSDYVNANFVRGSTGSACAYVASQGPLPNTVVDFWRLIWECEVRVIVMACNETESGKYKCETYWPAVNDQEQQYGNITAQQIDWRQVCPDFLVRTFRITCDNKERIVCQFHYTTWPDHGVPTTVGPILELVRLMRDVQATEATPILVHCSAGCGRTGTICSIDYVWALLRTGKLKEDFSLYKIIHEMRRQRIAMVQTQEQYILCYRAVAALFEQQLKVIDAHTYENLDEDGEPYHKFAEEANSSSDDEESSPGISEAEIHYRVQRSATFPSKDMKQLVDSWKSKKMTATPSTELPSHPSDSIMFNENQGSHDNKQEKLIGKATVIRRPSIAKFKAMFGSMELAHHQLRSQHSQSHPHHLHNPSHFRPLEPPRLETPSDNGNNNNPNNNNNDLSNKSTNNGNNNNYFHGNNFSSRFQDSDCTDSVATSDQEAENDREPSSHYQITANPLCEPKKPFSYLAPEQLKAFSVHHLNHNHHHHQQKQQQKPPSSPSPPPPPQLIGDTSNQDLADDDEIDGQPTYESPADIIRRQQQQQQQLHLHQQKQQHHINQLQLQRQQQQSQFPPHPMFQRSFDDGMINLMNKHRSSLLKDLPPPPKPPRTFQYGTKGNTISHMNGRALLSPLESNNSGRIIVSVAKRVRPRIHIPDDERPSFPESKSHNDLYSASTYSNLPFSFARSSPAPPPSAPSSTMASQSSQVNQYYGYISSGKHQLDKLSQDSNNQPLYERLKHDLFQTQTNGHDLSSSGRSLFRPPIHRMPLTNVNKIINRGGGIGIGGGNDGLPQFLSPHRNLPEPNRFGNLTVRREITSPPLLMQNPHPSNPLVSRNHGIFPGLNGQNLVHPIPSRPRPPIKLPDCNDLRSVAGDNNKIGQQATPNIKMNSFNNNSSNNQQQEQQQINRSNGNNNKPNQSNNGTPRSGIPISATPTPGTPIGSKFNNNKSNKHNNNMNNNTSDKSSSEVGGRTNENKKKSTKSNSKSDSKLGNQVNQGNQETKKHSSFSFSSTFFPFRKTTKSKSSASPNQQSGPQSIPGNNTNIRPPHSHRFSPPTQWTQV